MDIKSFKERCEGVILVDELPPLSELRQKVAGCYEVFGMCPQGEPVALDVDGNVNCLKAEINRGAHLCEDDGSPCSLKAEPSDILGVINLLRNFLIENFITKKGILTKEELRKGSRQGDDPPARKGKATAGSDYTNEDLGISRHLSEGERARRRHAAQKDKPKR